MDDTSKYLIHAAITADGVVERSDVVGAIFGQTEGLLGDDLDLRDLQQSSKVGRIDVEIDSEGGQSFGHITIASSLDKVETAILAASLETITRVGPCRSEVRVTDVEDIREAKRREVVERAKELLGEAFDESIMSSKEILEEVRESVRVEDITTYEDLPAGPRVSDSDAIIVVEGRADVLTLLRYGVKNAIAVEGTNVPEAVADLSQDRTVTAFFDGDRGGELILRELAQVGAVDYVAFAPEGQSVEDLTRHEVMSALRDKVPYQSLSSGDLPLGTPAESDEAGGDTDPQKEPWATTESPAAPAPDGESGAASERDSHVNGSRPTDRGADGDVDARPAVDSREGSADVETASGARRAQDADATPVAESSTAAEADTEADAETDAETAAGTTTAEPHRVENGTQEAAANASAAGDETEQASTGTPETPERPETASPHGRDRADEATPGGDDSVDPSDEQPTDGDSDGRESPETLRGHVRTVIGASTGNVRFLDEDLQTVAEDDAAATFELLRDADSTPYAVVLDGELTQRVLDVAAQRGTEHIVSRSNGEFVKRPVDVRIRSASQLLESHPTPE